MSLDQPYGGQVSAALLKVDSLAIMGKAIHSVLSNEVMIFHALNYFIHCESIPAIEIAGYC